MKKEVYTTNSPAQYAEVCRLLESHCVPCWGKADSWNDGRAFEPEITPGVSLSCPFSYHISVNGRDAEFARHLIRKTF